LERVSYVLDVLPTGWPGERSFNREPVAIALGQDEFKLLEVVLRPGTTSTPGEKLNLVASEGLSPCVDHVRRRLSFQELTTAARSELPRTIEAIVLANPERFLRFFNESQAITRRFHMLELLPGVGKKTMDAIVRERQKAPFKSLQDLEERLKLHQPHKLIVARVEKELTGEEEKYRVFVPR